MVQQCRCGRTRITGSAFTQVLFGAGRLEADAVLAFVVLAGRRLRIQQSYHRLDFAEFTRMIARTFAKVIVDAVHADTSVLKME